MKVEGKSVRVSSKPPPVFGYGMVEEWLLGLSSSGGVLLFFSVGREGGREGCDTMRSLNGVMRAAYRLLPSYNRRRGRYMCLLKRREKEGGWRSRQRTPTMISTKDTYYNWWSDGGGRRMLDWRLVELRRGMSNKLNRNKALGEGVEPTYTFYLNIFLKIS